ncbi:putative rhamnosyl transferase [Sedimentitalea todarodis]|uniref:Rhamnosyl transferase n=1 Tax=Sedimentitalea todarodis TaxID=1631240 RepID=A0ABU3VGB0_9RHOB|nr:putative rhamnosyl transferase [Sedimentitalea todarodis]MDU9005020.1 putative rhamnosyl transferase [Sedimentitalea todarodis]
MQVIGLCRFSYPAIGGFQIEHETLDERIAYLYATERLEERFRFFETITLPGIRAQSDPDFTFLIVIGDSLPDRHCQRLQKLIADIPQAVILAYPPGEHRRMMQKAINAHRLPSHEPCLQFRLDDDDAVAFTYIERLRDAARDVAPLLRNHRHVAIDFNQGYVARPDANGIAAMPIQTPYWTPALALMLRPDVRVSVMNFSHGKLYRTMPTVTLTGDDMMLRGFNGYNDSRLKKTAKPVKLTPLTTDGELLFQMTYGIDSDHVRRVFSAPI